MNNTIYGFAKGKGINWDLHKMTRTTSGKWEYELIMSGKKAEVIAECERLNVALADEKQTLAKCLCTA